MPSAAPLGGDSGTNVAGGRRPQRRRQGRHRPGRRTTRETALAGGVHRGTGPTAGRRTPRRPSSAKSLTATVFGEPDRPVTSFGTRGRDRRRQRRRSSPTSSSARRATRTASARSASIPGGEQRLAQTEHAPAADRDERLRLRRRAVAARHRPGRAARVYVGRRRRRRPRQGARRVPSASSEGLQPQAGRWLSGLGDKAKRGERRDRHIARRTRAAPRSRCGRTPAPR